MDDQKRSQFVQRAVLCKSLSNNKVDLLTITDRNSSKHGVELEKRRGIILSARTHPGETNGSWVMKGILNFLTDPDDPDAQTLRSNFVFKVIPMVNVDGVI